MSLENWFDAVAGGWDLVDDVIAVSFVEHLPLPGDVGSEDTGITGTSLL